jgi:hypothetical protein
MHVNPISDMVLYNERFVFSNCMEGKVYHWEIMDIDKLSGKPENPHRNMKETYNNCHAHDSSKPYTAFIYDEKLDLFVGCLPEK